ncbi:hypothetical protein PsorP6_008386 [Peronosclerospora sorghi]|uniref:Uncharacterized protein n=1 Tax=Peronosclerospora sorghi TaxID=230839 RepID=A0ACC0WBK6_9STRA|nr:hypothetical protein PsorP6_008386 [Peronosclerospora sorghi]
MAARYCDAVLPEDWILDSGTSVHQVRDPAMLVDAGPITDFEYTVECAVFDMLDIVLVHGWLLDDKDHSTVG